MENPSAGSQIDLYDEIDVIVDFRTFSASQRLLFLEALSKKPVQNTLCVQIILSKDDFLSCKKIDPSIIRRINKYTTGIWDISVLVESQNQLESELSRAYVPINHKKLLTLLNHQRVISKSGQFRLQRLPWTEDRLSAYARGSEVTEINIDEELALAKDSASRVATVPASSKIKRNIGIRIWFVQQIKRR